MHHIGQAVLSRTPSRIANHNAHSIYLTKKNPDFAAFFTQADLIEIDSTPLIFFTRALGLHSRRFHRCTYLDWRDHFWSVAARNNWRVFYLGGAPGVAERAAARLTAERPGLQLATRHGYFDQRADSAENAEVLAAIRDFDADVILVGMGMPLQEAWIQVNRAALPHGVMLSIGAAFDYEAGVQAAAPRWMGRLGVEWLFRLVSQPRRLAHRYLVEPWSLAPAALDDLRAAFRAGV